MFLPSVAEAKIAFSQNFSYLNYTRGHHTSSNNEWDNNWIIARHFGLYGKIENPYFQTHFIVIEKFPHEI